MIVETKYLYYKSVLPLFPQAKETSAQLGHF